MSDLAERLESAGLYAAEADAKAALFARASSMLASLRAEATGRLALGWFVPGRIEVLGKHTDYAGGRSLLCTVEKGICLVAARRDDAEVRVATMASRGVAELALDPDLDVDRRGWTRYAAVVCRRLARDFAGARTGADIAIASDLPIAAGVSSSSALVVGLGLALARVNGLEDTEEWRREIGSREDLAGYLSAVENGRPFGRLAGGMGVGTRGGSEDHTSMLCCSAGMLSQYSFVPVRHEASVRLPEDCRFVVGVSGVVAEKAGAALDLYNQAELVTRRLLDLWNARTGRVDPSLGAAAGSSKDAPATLRAIAGESRDPDVPVDLLVSRLDQFLDESFTIIPEVVRRIEAGEIDRIAPLVARSQAGAENGLRNQTPETRALVRSALELGAVAASAFGAGFGGSVWALVEAERAATFAERWLEAYRAEFAEHAAAARAFATKPGPSVIEAGEMG